MVVVKDTMSSLFIIITMVDYEGLTKDIWSVIRFVIIEL